MRDIKFKKRCYGNKLFKELKLVIPDKVIGATFDGKVTRVHVIGELTADELNLIEQTVKKHSWSESEEAISESEEAKFTSMTLEEKVNYIAKKLGILKA